jgi:hypothetical protein
VFANNAAACIKTLDSRSKPAVFCASVREAPVFRLGLHAGPEVIRESDFTIWLDEPHFQALILFCHADTFYCWARHMKASCEIRQQL